MRTLLHYEIKKILQKKSTWVALAVLLTLQIGISLMGNMGKDEVDAELVETHMQRNQTDRANGLALSGSVIDQNLITKMQEAYAAIDMTDEKYPLTKEYQKGARPYSDLYQKMSVWISGQNSVDITNVDADALHQLRRENQQDLYTAYALSEKEISYWEKQEEKLPAQFTYQYATSYENMTDMMGCYMSLMLLTFFIAVVMGNVFVEEHARKTNPMIQCARNGKGKLYMAKILAGSIVSLVTALLFLCVLTAGSWICYGPEGFNASIQVASAFLSSYHLSIGQVFLIFGGVVLLASVLLGILTMILAEIMHNSVGALAIMIGGLFAARLIVVPVSLGLISELWNLIPINLVKQNQGFLDLRLFTIGKLQLTGWQMAPILYVLIGAVALLIGKYSYCRNRD